MQGPWRRRRRWVDAWGVGGEGWCGDCMNEGKHAMAGYMPSSMLASAWGESGITPLVHASVCMWPLHLEDCRMRKFSGCRRVARRRGSVRR
jgi:hypothetical protein